MVAPGVLQVNPGFRQVFQLKFAHSVAQAIFQGIQLPCPDPVCIVRAHLSENFQAVLCQGHTTLGQANLLGTLVPTINISRYVAHTLQLLQHFTHRLLGDLDAFRSFRNAHCAHAEVGKYGAM
jgi:hypothetical protein